MSTIVDRIRAKVTRAKQHIQDFQLALRAFQESRPYTVGMKEDPQAGKRIYYVSKVEPIPYALTAITADVIQNLRSPLDHIASQLVLHARSGTEPDWHVYYPISGSATEYPATRGGKIKGVRQEVVDAIDATEPYKGGKGHALWQLNELNKFDKHELLIGAGPFCQGIDISVALGDRLREVPGLEHLDIPPFLVRFARPSLALHVGDELWSQPINQKMTVQRGFTFEVALNAPGVIDCEPALKTLHDLTNLVDYIITTLGRFLP